MKDIITFPDFLKLDIRVGTIVTAERVPNSDKLIRMDVDLGEEKRQIVGGLYPDYEPEMLVGKQSLVLVNLAPKMMMGLESRGMLLAADFDNKAVLTTTLSPVPNGTLVR